MARKSESTALLPKSRQKAAEHDGVAQSLLEMDKQVFVLNGLAVPRRFSGLLFAGAGLKSRAVCLFPGSSKRFPKS